MSQFTEFTSIEPIPKRRLWVTTKPLWRELWEEGSWEFICVPSGFIFDGCTIPKIFGMIAQKVEAETIGAGCTHDYVYVCKHLPIYQRINWVYIKSREKRFTRKEADEIFLQACLACGVSKRKAYTMYYVIRACWRPIRAWFIHTT